MSRVASIQGAVASTGQVISMSFRQTSTAPRPCVPAHSTKREKVEAFHLDLLEFFETDSIPCFCTSTLGEDKHDRSPNKRPCCSYAADLGGRDPAL